MKSILNSKRYLDDARFRFYIEEHLTDLAQKRQKLIDDTLIHNIKRKITTEIVMNRSSYSRLLERGLMTVDGVIDEAEKIMSLKSELSSAERMFLGDLLEKSMIKTIDYYKDKNK